jgi:cytoskeletal protein RodZ
MYSKFLGVDVTEQSRDLDHRGNRLSIDEYQYLNHAPEPKAVEAVPTRTRRERKPPSVVPLLIFLAVGAVVLGVMYYEAYWPRIQTDKESTTNASPTPESDKADKAEKTAPIAAAPVSAPVAPATPARGAIPVAVPAAVPAAVAVPTTRVAPPPVAFANAAPVIAPPAVRESDSALLERELAERAASDTRPAAPQSNKDKVQIVPLRRTGVTIRQPGPDGPIKFEGVIYPEAQPLTVPTPAFIVLQDQTAVRIQKGGQPIAYQSPGISVQ